MKSKYDVIVVGGGFYGMYVAEYHARQGSNVLLCEKEDDYMKHASYINQARVHNGYHYPRSILTAVRSTMSFPRFVKEFKDCIDDSFEKYYLIGKILSNITAKQFEIFCKRIDAPCELAGNKIKKLYNPHMIEAAFSTVEFAFDAVKLKEIMCDRISHAGVDVLLDIEVKNIYSKNGSISIETCETNGMQNTNIFQTKQVYNCTYSMINNLLSESNIDRIPLKHELAELCLVEPPSVLKDKGLTIMCGPFFSIMPFPSKSLHSFSHVRYTPHFQWYDSLDDDYLNGHQYINSISKRTNWKKMKLDSIRYLPILSEMTYHESLWEIKTVLPRSESNDARPILFKKNHGIEGVHCVMGGKIDNVYDVIHAIDDYVEA